VLKKNKYSNKLVMAESYLDDLRSSCADLDQHKISSSEFVTEARSILMQFRIAASSAQKQKYLAQLRPLEQRIQDEERKLLVGNAKQTPADTMESKSLARLHDALKMLHESESVAADTMTQLVSQGETLKKTNLNMKTIGDDLGDSNKLLNRMNTFWRR
jgi:paraquat-inducible protein B